MWKQILFAMLLALAAATSTAQVHKGESDLSGCIPDSVLFSENSRWWYPGEPLQWADSALLDSLLNSDLETFSLVTQSPRSLSVRRRIHCMRSPEGRTALFVIGDHRYISYNRETLENASQSNVVGHSDGAVPYWLDSTLFFQNGRANWFLHAQRLFHSQQTLEIEQSQTNAPPEGAEHAFVFVLDSAAYFVMLNGSLEFAKGPTSVISLPHDGMGWLRLGKLNPSITKLRNRTVPWHLSNYVVAINSGSALVIRKSDLQFKLVPSSIAVKMQAELGSGNVPRDFWLGWKGDTMMLSASGEKTVENVTEITRNGKWAPLIIPFDDDELPPEEMEGPKDNWGLVALALAALCIALAVSLGIIRRKSPPPFLQRSNLDALPLSPHIQTLLSQPKHQFTSEELDTLLGLGDVPSPETRRSRRARIVQLVNAESLALFGKPILERTRSETDKRMFIYVLSPPKSPE